MPTIRASFSGWLLDTPWIIGKKKIVFVVPNGAQCRVTAELGVFDNVFSDDVLLDRMSVCDEARHSVLQAWR